ncbi:MAG: gliding motility-associated C-terminal domain-containing protein [Bacteroidia bacterium]|nr:gliding motility-associated C-terminal domain-containing protein [Bacteroidia bacterium]
MKKIYLAIILFVCSVSLKAQDYYMDLYTTQTVTACKGNVFPSFNCAAFGYAAYCNNENYTVTFYSGNPLIPMKISFLSLGLLGFPTTDCIYTEAGFDFLTIINGPSIGSPTLASISGTVANPVSYQSTGAYLTINFKSDNVVNDWGWNAIIGCQPQNCSGNLPASDVCASAVPICDLNGYCGATNGWYTPDNATLGVNLGGPFCGASGSIENNSWIKFIPNSATANINIAVQNCSSPTQGLQAGLFSTPNCSAFTLLTCQSQATYAPVMTLSYNSFVPGNTYYIMIDGFAGNACDYTVSASSGVAISTVNVSSNAICFGQSSNLTAIAAGSTPSYTWSTGANTAGITVSPALTTAYTATIASGFCTEIITKTITVNPLPVANAGTSPASITCASPTQVLSGSGGGTYAWSGTGIVSGGGTANPTINQAGPFSLVVTSGAGCTSTNVATVSVPVNTVLPIPAISSPTVLNCSNPSMNLTGSPASNVNYSWTGPGIVSGSATATPLINAGGTYNLNVTSTINGCSSATSIAIAAPNTTITNSPTTTGSVTCVNMLINLNTPAVAGQNYTWTAPAGAAITSGANAAAATGSNSGTYSVTVFNTTNGCSSTSVVAAVVNTVQGVPNATSAGTVTCANNAINLSSLTTGVTYTWVAPVGSSISSGGNTANASGNGGGTYTLNVTNSVNGCTNTNIAAVTTQTVKPIAVINSTPVITCNNPTVNITGGPVAGVTYTWSGGTIVGSANNNNANVSSAAVYSLAVTSTSNGCTSTTAATVNITSNLTTPAITAIGSQTANSGCGTSSIVVLSGTATPAGSTYTWASSGGFSSGVNNSTVAVNGATTYTLNSTHPVTGCISSLVYTVSPSVNQPTVTASSSNGTLTCVNTIQSTTVTSNPSTGVTYAWTGPGIVGPSNTSVVSGSLAGVYNLTVTNTSNNCNTTVSYNLAANNTPITPNAVATNSINCNNTTATISTAPTPTATAFNYTWSAGPNTSSIVVNPTVNTSYTVTVQNPANGCTGTAVYNVIANTVPPTAVNVSPNNVLLACPAQTAFITGSATGAVSYSWVAPAGGSILAGANTATAQVTSSSIGTFSLIATAANGCSAAAGTATVSPNTNAPTFSLSNANPSITCLTASPNVTVALTSTVAIQGYTWSPTAGIVGTNSTAAVSFSAPGIYTVVIEATNGCLSTGTVSVGNATTAPTIVAGTATAQNISCTNTIVSIAPTFTPSANLTYTWSGPGIVGSPNNANVQVNQNGSYSLTVTNTLTGCSTTSLTVPVVGTNVPPSLNVSSSSSIGIGCQPNTSTVSLTASSAGSVTYSWSTGATSSVINTANAGTYTVTVTDNNSGCSATQTITVANNTTTPSFTASASGNLPCGGAGTTTLNAQASNTNVIYNWSGPAITNGSNTANPEVNGAGVYTVIVTDNITGCASTQTVSVSSTSVVAAFNPDVTSGVAPLTVNFTNQSIGAITYSWSFGNGTSTQVNPTNVFSPGTYTVVLTSMNGACTSTAEIVIKVNNKIGNIPEVFTPNGDGHNDVFEITGLDSYPNNSLQIFNRWGNQVYFAKPYKNDWDGSPNANGKTGSNKLPTATYFYILDLGDQDQTIMRGFIQLQY